MSTHNMDLWNSEVHVLLMSSYNMFLWKNKKYINTFGLKKASYQELSLGRICKQALEDTNR